MAGCSEDLELAQDKVISLWAFPQSRSSYQSVFVDTAPFQEFFSSTLFSYTELLTTQLLSDSRWVDSCVCSIVLLVGAPYPSPLPGYWPSGSESGAVVTDAFYSKPPSLGF